MQSVCYVCGDSATRPVLHKGRWTYRGCAACHHAWLDPIPSATELTELYGKAYFASAANGGYADYEGDAALHRANAEDRLQRLDAKSVRVSTATTTPRTIVDIGCATGFFLAVAQAAGWSVAGVELSPWARNIASQRLGVPVFATLAAAYTDGVRNVDAVTFFQVLEHIADPRAALVQARALIATGGTLLIETWNRDSLIARAMRSHWQQVTPPSVVHLFSRASATRLLAATGFAGIEIWRTSKRVSIGFVSNLLRQKYRRLGGIAAAGVQRLRLEARSVRYALGDLVTVRAHAR